MTNNRLLLFIAIVLSILTIAVIWVGVNFSKSQTVVTATEQENVASETATIIPLDANPLGGVLLAEPLRDVERGDVIEESVVEYDQIAEDGYVSAGTGMLYDPGESYHPTTGEPLYWVGDVEVSGEEWYEATGGAEEGRGSLEEIEEMRRDNNPSPY